MSPTRAPAITRSRPRAPALRLLPDLNPALPSAHAEPRRGKHAPPPALRVISDPARILLAGSDAGRRATLRDELTETLPANVMFEEADAVCDVLEQAPGIRMAIIAGDLEDTPAESLMHMLAHRHPELPVLIVGSPAASDSGQVSARRELRIQHA